MTGDPGQDALDALSDAEAAEFYYARRHDERTLHVPGQIGTHDAEGWRTFQPPGDVCLGCSDADAGHWVPVTECGAALAIFELQQAEVRQLHEEGLRVTEERDT